MAFDGEVFDTLVDTIVRGGLDDNLDSLAIAISKRREIQTLIKTASFKTGMRVRFTETVNPTYLRGVEATITGKRTKKWLVRIDQPVGKFRGGSIIVSPNLIEPV